jgi:GT2 family glycosyltransferase
VVVIDNGSEDGTVDMVRSMFPDVHLFLNSENLGVARARNHGISVSCGEYVVLLDDDTECSSDFVRQIINYMDLRTEIGIMGPKLCSPNGEVQPSARPFPTVRGILGRGLSRITPDTFRSQYLFKFMNSPNPIEVSWVLGACQFIRRETIKEIGLLDSKYFFGYEDVDYCRRASETNWKVFYHPGIMILHHYQRKSAKSWFSKMKYHHLRSIFRYFYKYGITW